MEKEKRFYIFGNVYHQDNGTKSVELIGDAATKDELSIKISRIMNSSFPPKNIFVIEGTKRIVEIKEVSII